MSSPLEQAFQEASKLPRAEQDAFAAFLLAELKDERAWEKSFANSQDALARLAEQARKDHAEGWTRPLDDLLQ